MQELWDEYEAWLKENFPEGISSLNPGASSEAIADLQAEIDAQLPEPYVACLKVHNGQEIDSVGLLWSDEFLSTSRIGDELRCMRKLLEEMPTPIKTESEPPGKIKEVWWDRMWIPIASDGSGNLTCLDLDPGPNGSVGQIIDFDHETIHRTWLAESFETWFEEYVQDVVADTYVYSDDDGRLIEKSEMD